MANRKFVVDENGQTTIVVDARFFNPHNLTEAERKEVRRKAQECMERVTEISTDPYLMLKFDDLRHWANIRALAEIVGIETATTIHNHRCPKDGTVWRHDPITTYWSGDKEVYIDSHRCPNCRAEQYRVDNERFSWEGKED